MACLIFFFLPPAITWKDLLTGRIAPLQTAERHGRSENEGGADVCRERGERLGTAHNSASHSHQSFITIMIQYDFLYNDCDNCCPTRLSTLGP